MMPRDYQLLCLRTSINTLHLNSLFCPFQDAIAAKSYFPEEKKVSQGDFAAGYASSPMKLEGSIHIGGQEHFYLEAFGCVAIPKGENGEMEVFASTQNVDGTQKMIAKALGIPANRIVARVKRIGKCILPCLDMSYDCRVVFLGGGFGGKETRSYLLSTATAIAANK